MLASFAASAQQDSLTAEDRAYEAIEKLPEIQQMIKNDTGKVWHLSMRTIKSPGGSFKYFWIQVGQTNSQRFYTQYNFYVDAKDMVVYMLDTQTDSVLTLTQWRLKEK